MRIGYGKIGRSFNLDPKKATSIGGDIDVLNLLNRLARQFPEHEFVLVGKNSGEVPQSLGYPENITNPWTEWREVWEMASDPKEADKVIDNFRRISGNIHETLDQMIVWAGQHGSANSRIPMIGSDWIIPPGTEVVGMSYDGTNTVESNAGNDIITGGVGENLATPQYAFVHYISWYLDLISRWREAGDGPLEREEIWLCPDPRNYLKCRELRWPPRYPVLAQYDFHRYHKAERFGRFPPVLSELDPSGYREQSRWVSNVAYCYSGLELTAVGAPDEVKFDPRPGPHRFGMVINENLLVAKDGRKQILQSWVLPNFSDAEIRGHWTEKSQLELGRIIEPCPYPEVAGVMKSFATTLTTPASGSEWATAKPWEAFALGSICFFHPRYDGQGHILPLKSGSVGHYQDARARSLASFLRINDAKQLVERVNDVTTQPELFHTIATEQRRHYEFAFKRWEGGTIAVADRLRDYLFARSATGELSSGAPWTVRTTPPSAKVANRGAARPRGTNEERKHKAPISRRRRIREEVLVAARNAEEPDLEASIQPEEDVVENEERSFVVETVTSNLGTTTVENLPKPKFLNPSEPLARFTGGLSFIGGSAVVLTKPEVTTTPANPTSRESWDEFYLELAHKYAERSTCSRRSVGCILTDANNKQIGQGYNGVPRGFPHCNEGHTCPGATSASGRDLDKCYSAHAEINALLVCQDVSAVKTVYLTVSPCTECIKALLNTGATRIVFREEYVHPESKALWLSRTGNEWVKL